VSLKDFKTQTGNHLPSKVDDAEETSGNESKEHYNEKISQAKQLQSKGFTVEVEKSFPSGFRVDVYGVNGDREVCVEVGTTTFDKVRWAKQRFDEFIHSAYYRHGSAVKDVRKRTDNTTVNLSQESKDHVDEIKESSKWSPSNREIVDRAIKQLAEQELGSEQTAEDNNNNE